MQAAVGQKHNLKDIFLLLKTLMHFILGRDMCADQWDIN